jgi:Arc/MetJ family transcription regulator
VLPRSRDEDHSKELSPAVAATVLQATGVKRADDLYGLPLDEFTKARDELARELRNGGKKEAADDVKAMRKPSVSAWTVNQLARRHPQEMKALVKAGDELRKAQRQAVSGRGPDALRDATRSHRGALDALTSAARDELGADGTTLQRAVQTLRSASVDKEASKGLLAGTLTGDVEQSGFGSLLSVVPPGQARAKARSRPKAKPKPPPKPKPDPNAAKRARVQKQLENARAKVSELEAQLRDLGG